MRPSNSTNPLPLPPPNPLSLPIGPSARSARQIRRLGGRDRRLEWHRRGGRAQTRSPGTMNNTNLLPNSQSTKLSSSHSPHHLPTISDPSSYQGINVCIVALDDALLKTAHAQLQKDFQSVEIRAIPVNLASDPQSYMSTIISATRDIRVSILINNAGFLLMSFFERRPLEQQIANVECNANAAVRLTHHFYSRMIDQRIHGLITFTSSAACFMVRPLFTIPFCCSAPCPC